MPLFQDFDHDLPQAYGVKEALILPENNMMRRMSEESIRTEDCDGPVPNDPTWANPQQVPEDHSSNGESIRTSDRQELMERIKRGESPTWVPNQSVCGSSTVIFWRLQCREWPGDSKPPRGIRVISMSLCLAYHVADHCVL